MYTSHHLPNWRVASYNIFELELAAALIGVIAAVKEYNGDIILLNIDIQAAMRSIIRGNSKQDVAAKLCQVTWFASAIIETSSAPLLWFEYVPSQLNTADGPSRIRYVGMRKLGIFPALRKRDPRDGQLRQEYI